MTSCLGTSLPYLESFQGELIANTNTKYFPRFQMYVKVRNYKIISASSYAKSLSTLIIHSSSPGGEPGITSPILVRSSLCHLLRLCALGRWCHVISLSFHSLPPWNGKKGHFLAYFQNRDKAQVIKNLRQSHSLHPSTTIARKPSKNGQLLNFMVVLL